MLENYGAAPARQFAYIATSDMHDNQSDATGLPGVKAPMPWGKDLHAPATPDSLLAEEGLAALQALAA